MAAPAAATLWASLCVQVLTASLRPARGVGGGAGRMECELSVYKVMNLGTQNHYNKIYLQIYFTLIQ